VASNCSRESSPRRREASAEVALTNTYKQFRCLSRDRDRDRDRACSPAKRRLV
jgi:hypothetical protein